MSYIVSVKIIDVDTGKETVLAKQLKGNKKDTSRCLFTDWLPYKEVEYQLRLDNNNKPTTQPTLDTDIRDAKTKKLLPKGEWHNKKMEFNPDLKMNIYDFKGFDNLVLRLYTVTTSAINLSSSAFIVNPKQAQKVNEDIKYWLNVDKPTKKCTLHTEGCTFEKKKKGTLFKEIGDIKKHGGWMAFSTVESAQVYFKQEWNKQGFELSKVCKCLSK